MKEIKNKCLNLLKEQKIETNNDIIKTSINYANNNFLEESEQLITHLINNTNKLKSLVNQSSYNLLLAITKYLNQIYQKDNQNLKIKTKKFHKTIKIIYKYLIKHFDDEYLLFHSLEDNQLFLSKENAIFLNFVEELILILNEVEYIKDADNLSILKNKVELGFNRYFINRKYNIILNQFKKDGTYKISNLKTLLKILNYYKPENYNLNDFIKKQISFKIIKKEKENDYEIYLLYLQLIKNYNKKQFTEEIKKNKKEIKIMPKLILNKKEIELQKTIIKSLNKDVDVKYIKQDNKYYMNPNSIEIINLTLNLL